MDEIEKHPLDRLFNARSLAVIGASANPERIGGRPIAYMTAAGFRGRLYPINPRYEEVQGLKCFAAMEDVPEPVDVAIIAVSAEKSIEAIKECGRNGTRYAIMFTAGFAETGEEGRIRQQELARVAREGKVRIIGPNSVGYTSSTAQIVGSFGSTWLRKGSLPLAEGSISFVTHSGAFGAFIYAMAQDSGVSFRHFINVGNEIDLSFTESLEYMIEDPKVKAVGGYIEGIRDGDRFVQVAGRANELGKPLVMIKVGRSERSEQAAMSHTAALVGSDKVYEGIFRECNVIRVQDVQQMLDILYLCQFDILPDDPGVALVSISGGTGVWAADQCGMLGIRLADFSADTRKRLEGVLPAFGSTLNPVDATAQLVNDPDMLKNALRAILADEHVALTFLAMGLQETHGEQFAKDVIAISQESNTPLIVGWVCGPQALYETFSDSGIPVFRDFYRPLLTLGKLIRYTEQRRRLAGSLDETMHRLLFEQRSLVTNEGDLESVQVLAEDQAKLRLRELGMPVPAFKAVRNADEAVEVADTIGYPVVLKGSAAGRVIHKTDMGLLKHGLLSGDEVRTGYEVVTTNAKHHFGDAGRIFVEQQAKDGRDMLVSLVQDDFFGFYVVIGVGGELVELLSETRLHRAPLNASQVGLVLEDSPRTLELLLGGRGRPPADVHAFIDLVVAISELPFRGRAGELVQLELNPVRVHSLGEGATILDVVWRLR